MTSLPLAKLRLFSRSLQRPLSASRIPTPLRQDTGDCSSLSDGARTSLKSALSVLGVSHDGLLHNGDEHSIFVLGLDAEDLREVVRFSRFISDCRSE